MSEYGFDRPVVAHFVYPVFLERSQTFVYQYISHLKQFHPVCLAWRFENLNQFLVPEVDLCTLSLSKYSIKWFYYCLSRHYFMRDAAAEKIAVEFLKKRKAVLIHAHFGTTGVITLKLKKILGVPHITTFYGFDVSKLAVKKRWRKFFKVLFREGDLFLVEGPHMKWRLENIGCPESKIKIQRIAIDLNRIVFKERMPKKNEKIILIFAGRFVEKKGLIYALQALKEVYNKKRNFEFRIIGDGLLKKRIIKFIKENSMESYVRLLGFLSYKDYLKEMQAADIFIHPSITAKNGDSEGGAPTTILEAQAMGMPVISSYHADIPNVVVPGKSALLSPEKDYRSLAENIIYLIDNQNEWKNMGRIGRDFVEENHNILKEVVKLEIKYSQLFNQTI